MFIKKNTEFKLANTRVVSNEDVHINADEKGIFIINLWTPCDVEDIDVIPVTYVGYLTDADVYLLRKDNIVVGGVNDICLK